jgi:hypothetical protein
LNLQNKNGSNNKNKDNDEILPNINEVRVIFLKKCFHKKLLLKIAHFFGKNPTVRLKIK